MGSVGGASASSCFGLTSLGGEREPVIKWKGAWPDEAIHVKKFCGQDVVRRSQGALCEVAMNKSPARSKVLITSGT